MKNSRAIVALFALATAAAAQTAAPPKPSNVPAASEAVQLNPFTRTAVFAAHANLLDDAAT